MSAEFFDRVGRSANFQAIKESSGDIGQLHMLARDYPHIALLCGMDDQALEFFAWGAQGWVCGAGNCLPQEHLALYTACIVENDFVKDAGSCPHSCP
jgi:4-hydroxy-tetrahydrodipicolinate synthase